MKDNKAWKLLKGIVKMKYLVLEILALCGFLFSYLALSIYFIENIFLPFFIDQSEFMRTLASVSFLIFWVYLFLSASFKWISTSGEINKSIKGALEEKD